MNELKLLVFIFLVTLSSKAQVTLKGKIINEDAVEGIHILNAKENSYAITNAKGEFEITVKKGDTLSVMSIMYFEKKLIIDDTVLSKELIEIELKEAVNELNEVVVGNRLTGDLKKDIAEVELLELPKFDYSWEAIEGAYIEDDELPLRNIITTKGQYVDGLNIKNIVLLVAGQLFKKKPKIDFKPQQTEEFNILYMEKQFGEDVFLTHFGITEDKEALFLNYCEADEDLMELFQQKNDLMLFDKMKQLSVEFNKL